MGIGAFLAGGQIAAGIAQSLAARRRRRRAMRRLEQNPFEVPESARRGVEIAGTLAQGTRLPGQELMEERLSSGTAQTVAGARRAATSPSQVLRSTVDAYLTQQQRQQELDMAAARDYQVRQGNYAQAVQSLAPYEVERWKYSTLYPVQADLNAAAMGTAAGQQNIGAGLSSFATLGAQDQYLKGLERMQGGGGSAPYNPLGLQDLNVQPYQSPMINVSGMRSPLRPMS